MRLMVRGGCLSVRGSKLRLMCFLSVNAMTYKEEVVNLYMKYIVTNFIKNVMLSQRMFRGGESMTDMVSSDHFVDIL